MQLLKKILPPTHRLILTSDWHLGSVLFSDHAVCDIVDRVKNEPNTYIAIGGDLIEAICVDDKRFDIATNKRAAPLEQAKAIIELLMPIKEKILFILCGNHEYALHRYGDIIKDIICEQLGVDYGTYSCKCLIRMEDVLGIEPSFYKLFYTHGARSLTSTADDPIRRLANMQLSLKRMLMHKAADCEIMAMGHTHKLLVAEPAASLYLVDDGHKIQQCYTGPGDEEYIHPDHRWYCNTGSMMRLYAPGLGVSGYAERFGFDPVELGYCEVVVEAGQIARVEKRVV